MMPRKHWAFEVFMARIKQGETAAEAKAFIRVNFPELEEGYLTRILDNMGDTEKADIDYANQVANQQFRSRLETIRGRSRQTFEIPDAFFRDQSDGRPISAATRGRQNG